MYSKKQVQKVLTLEREIERLKTVESLSSNEPATALWATTQYLLTRPIMRWVGNGATHRNQANATGLTTMSISAPASASMFRVGSLYTPYMGFSSSSSRFLYATPTDWTGGDTAAQNTVGRYGITVGAWFYLTILPSTSSANKGIMAAYADPGASRGWIMYANTSDAMTVSAYNSTLSYPASPTTTLETIKWYFGVLRWTPSTEVKAS